MVEKVRSRMKAHFFDMSDPISITALFATLKLTSSTNNVGEASAIWLPPIVVNKALATTLDSSMSAPGHIPSVFASVNKSELLIQ